MYVPDTIDSVLHIRTNLEFGHVNSLISRLDVVFDEDYTVVKTEGGCIDIVFKDWKYEEDLSMHALLTGTSVFELLDKIQLWQSMTVTCVSIDSESE